MKSGWFNAEVMLYMAFVAVANYTQPNFELGYALKFMRLELLVLTAVFNWIGFLAGTVIVICSICFNKTLELCEIASSRIAEVHSRSMSCNCMTRTSQQEC